MCVSSFRRSALWSRTCTHAEGNSSCRNTFLTLKQETGLVRAKFPPGQVCGRGALGRGEPCVLSTKIQGPKQGHAERCHVDSNRAQLRLRTVVLGAQRNLKMYLVPPFPSRMHKPRPSCLLSGHTTKAKTTIRSFKKESVLTLRLVKKKKEKKEFAMSENRVFPVIRMTDRQRSAHRLSQIPMRGRRLEWLTKASFQVEEPTELSLTKVFPGAQGTLASSVG